MGGFEGLLDRYPQAVPTNVSAIVVNTTCHWPDPQSFRMLRDVDDDYMPWLGFLLGQTPSSLWYWCTDQVIDFYLAKDLCIRYTRQIDYAALTSRQFKHCVNDHFYFQSTFQLLLSLNIDGSEKSLLPENFAGSVFIHK